MKRSGPSITSLLIVSIAGFVAVGLIGALFLLAISFLGIFTWLLIPALLYLVYFVVTRTRARKASGEG